MNKIFLIGNVTKDVELKETSNGVSFSNFSIAVNRDYSNGAGERDTDFFSITAWRSLAENCAKFLKKGKKVCVVGTVQTRSYESEKGEKHFVFDVVAEQIEFLSPKNKDTVIPGQDKFDSVPVNGQVVPSENP